MTVFKVLACIVAVFWAREIVRSHFFLSLVFLSHMHPIWKPVRSLLDLYLLFPKKEKKKPLHWLSRLMSSNKMILWCLLRNSWYSYWHAWRRCFWDSSTRFTHCCPYPIYQSQNIINKFLTPNDKLTTLLCYIVSLPLPATILGRHASCTVLWKKYLTYFNQQFWNIGF